MYLPSVQLKNCNKKCDTKKRIESNIKHVKCNMNESLVVVSQYWIFAFMTTENAVPNIMNQSSI